MTSERLYWHQADPVKSGVTEVIANIKSFGQMMSDLQESRSFDRKARTLLILACNCQNHRKTRNTTLSEKKTCSMKKCSQTSLRVTGFEKIPILKSFTQRMGDGGSINALGDLCDF